VHFRYSSGREGFLSIIGTDNIHRRRHKRCTVRHGYHRMQICKSTHAGPELESIGMLAAGIGTSIPLSICRG
jgi:hypothetical protein